MPVSGKMAAAPNLFLRLLIIFGMCAAVLTILYFTPMPNQHFKSCDRPCHDLDWPMICRIKLNLETYQTMTGTCQDCPNNSTNCDNKYCASGDGSIRGILTANRQLPGPAIQVCKNDILVVDVTNKIPGRSFSVHWRGQPNHEAPFMDGVSMVTQCPIPSYTTFQYKFRASEAGTHYYHAHSDSDRTDGFFGALIVRQADKIEPHRKRYDIDSKDHVVILSEWSRDLSKDFNVEEDVPKAILINGKAPVDFGSPMSSFNVKKGKRYRFRVIYASGSVGCPISISIDNHLMKVISLDGNPINPYEVSSVVLNKGERLDVVLKTNQETGAYYLRTKSNCNNNELNSLAIINYEGVAMKEFPAKEAVKKEVKLRVFDTAICQSEIGKVCLGDVKSLNKIPSEVKESENVKKIYLGFDFKLGEIHDKEDARPDLRKKIYRVNNLTFTYPPSPVLTQPDDIPLDLTCSEFSTPESCADQDICECIHVEFIPLGTAVEIILIDQGGGENEHIFHLHGNKFYIVGANTFDRSITKEDAKILDSTDKLIKRNLNYPVLKDTVRVPKFGVVAIRFAATNPGFWMLRDEQSRGYTRGLDLILQVGTTSEMIPTPTGFPTCGNFIGPDFFFG